MVCSAAMVWGTASTVDRDYRICAGKGRAFAGRQLSLRAEEMLGSRKGGSGNRGWSFRRGAETNTRGRVCSPDGDSAVGDSDIRRERAAATVGVTSPLDAAVEVGKR